MPTAYEYLLPDCSTAAPITPCITARTHPWAHCLERMRRFSHMSGKATLPLSLRSLGPPRQAHSGRRQPGPVGRATGSGGWSSCAGLRLVRLAPDPAVRRDGVLPEELLHNVLSPAGEILPNEVKCFRERPHRFAVRPVTAEEQPVRAENFIEFIKRWAVETQVARDSTTRSGPPAVLVDTLEDFGDLDVHLGALSKLLPRSLVSAASRRCLRDLGVRQVIDHNPELRNLVGDSHEVCKQARLTRAIQHQTSLGEGLHVGNELGLRYFLGEVQAILIVEPDAPKQWVLVQS